MAEEPSPSPADKVMARPDVQADIKSLQNLTLQSARGLQRVWHVSAFMAHLGTALMGGTLALAGGPLNLAAGAAAGIAGCVKAASHARRHYREVRAAGMASRAFPIYFEKALKKYAGMPGTGDIAREMQVAHHNSYRNVHGIYRPGKPWLPAPVGLAVNALYLMAAPVMAAASSVPFDLRYACGFIMLVGGGRHVVSAARRLWQETENAGKAGNEKDAPSADGQDASSPRPSVPAPGPKAENGRLSGSFNREETPVDPPPSAPRGPRPPEP